VITTREHQAYGLRLDFPNDLLDINGSYSYYGDALNPGLEFAFQPRPGKGSLIGNLVRRIFTAPLNLRTESEQNYRPRTFIISGMRLSRAASVRGRVKSTTLYLSPFRGPSSMMPQAI